jgi:hypothetical protein
MDGRNGESIRSPHDMFGRFTAELTPQIQPWQQSLLEQPGDLESIEKTVHQAFARGADMMVAGLIAGAIASESLQQAAAATGKQFSQPLQKGRERTIAVRLLGGMLIWATTLYCAPKKKRFARGDRPRVGLDITLAQFGFGKGVSPGLQSRVARSVALCPSIAFAHQELARQGVHLDVKAVKRITYQCGNGLLSLRRHRIELLRQGKLPAGDELAGKRVSVQIDGGRMKIRGKLGLKTGNREPLDEDGLPTADPPGRSQKRAARTYDADWREPKLMTIFVHDATGRMEKETQATIDGTLEGPDAIAEIVAMHLHRLGAARAKSVAFVADGAPWIWDRIDKIVELAGLGDVPVHQVLDCCHAVHHVSLALAAIGLNRQERNPLYRRHRTLLRNGQWREVVDELSQLDDGDESMEGLQTEIAYLRRHGEAGRLAYVSFRRLGIPCGSGSIESGIRRVINLRLKSNGMFWKSEHAESMLQVRSQVVPGRWEEAMVELGEFRRKHAAGDWRWEPRPMSCKTESSNNLAV